MVDSLLYQYNDTVIGDTMTTNIIIDSASIGNQNLPINFLQSSQIDINPILHISTFNSDVITYLLLVLLGINIVIWYFLPDKFLSIFSLKPNSQLQRSVESSAKDLGALIVGVFWINFILSIGIFILFILESFFTNEISGLSQFEILSYIFLFIGGLLLYRFIIMFGAATIFQTQKIMKQQVVLGRNIIFITGVFLVPVVLIILYTGSNIIIYTTIVIIILSQAYRLMLIVIIGKSNTIFSALHIILYLCTLEIVPVLVLARLIGNGSVI